MTVPLQVAQTQIHNELPPYWEDKRKQNQSVAGRWHCPLIPEPPTPNPTDVHMAGKASAAKSSAQTLR